MVWAPSARRWTQDIPFTHRVIEDAHTELSMESLPWSMKTWCQFHTQSSVFHHQFVWQLSCLAIRQKVQPQFQGDREITTTTKVAGLNTDIHFECGPPMAREMRSSLARFHCNLSHAPKAGKLDSKILAGLDGLRYGTCLRLSQSSYLHHQPQQQPGMQGLLANIFSQT